MKILIFGASGLVGSNFHKYFKEQGIFCKGTHLSYKENETVYFNATNLLLPENNVELIIKERYDVFVICNALTNVDYCEYNESDSYLQTVQTAKNIVELAGKTNTKIVYISTDYVFDGTGGPYVETDITNPVNIYGKHKLLAEQIIIKGNPDALIVRITNVYGTESRNKNFVNRLTKSEERLLLKLPADQFATPVNALDIARAVYLLINDNKAGIYHLGGNDYYNRYQLACRIKSVLKKDNLILEYTDTSSLNQPARRPLKGGLLSFKFISEYPVFVFSNIDDYLLNQQ